MKTTLLALLALLCAPAAHAQTLDDLHWLKGCWRSVGDGPVITEVWTAPPMPAMLGYAFTTRDGELRDWEQTRIEMIDGWLHYVAMPRGRDPVRFRQVEMIHLDDVPSSVTFENAEHDYPQRVAYARDGNRLNATISLIDGSNENSFEYRRIACAANLRP